MRVGSSPAAVGRSELLRAILQETRSRLEDADLKRLEWEFEQLERVIEDTDLSLGE
jgi:hypothetical protein